MAADLPAPTGRTSPPLNRAAVVHAAVAFADREGLAAVSMRRLSAELGVVPMALYKHVTDKDDLVAAMIDAIVAGYAAPPPGLEWREGVRQRVLAARDALLQHPWLRTAIESATQRTPAVLGHMDAVAGEFAAGGLSYDLVHHAMHALGHRIWGFSPEAFSSPPAQESAPSSAPSADEQAAMVAAMAFRFPHIAAIAADSASRHVTGACDEQFEFEFTLDLLLEAVARLHAAQWSSS
ncbi:TetR/AcrR family transcriptional regulator [Microcella sp.]|uniref:TetR/AcrR family transcriptional regulator n=1 Tax=Microcella sp. TaxID=1913979 RepID=UPI00299F83EC|nr:TetR/AcrR family transcriptional regulator C-terminal domain-containing protein [Microcella sp.]MDX2026265.1 TetR/AcrR family transcriptional regulator C-terminal domain-containing protein [Microcella sp.]